MPTTPSLPRWDLSPFFPDSPPLLAAAHEQLASELARLEAQFDAAGISGGATSAPTTADHEACSAVLSAFDAVLGQARLLNGYLHARATADTTDDRAATLQSRVAIDLARIRVLTARWEAWVARMGAEELAGGGDVARDHRWPLLRAAARGEHLMSDPEESLAAELALSGANAWARLHRDITGRLTAEVKLHGEVERLPMAAVRGLATDPDPQLRRAAWDAEQVAWEGAAIPLAAAINGAKGEQLVLDRRRGWSDALSPALHHNAVDRDTLDALTEAVTASLDDFRRYLRAKAHLLGYAGGIRWWDLLAPVTSAAESSDVSWDEAIAMVRAAFDGYSPSLRNLIDRARADGWIDAGPRPGKVGGAYCMPLRDDESRILMNFTGSPSSTLTLAHELGHAYHNAQLAGRTWLQRQTPMALAETASIFCETLTVNALIEHATPEERLGLLDLDLQGTTQVVVDIHSRFLFESELCRRRTGGALSVEELCDLMRESQESAYGDGLDLATRHPWMWAVKGHYFTPFYNWPYTFGLLFGSGLAGRYASDPERFRAGYDDLLSATGLDDAAGLAARFDIDVRDVGFWTSALDVIRLRIDEFCSLAGSGML